MAHASSSFDSVKSRRITRAVVPWFISTTILLGGCAAHRKPSIAWSTAILVKPVVHPATSSPVADQMIGAPDLRVELTPPPKLAFRSINPPRPRVSSPTAAGADKNTADVLVLAPQLSPEETINAQRETNQNIASAEKNLASARARTLNAVQSDIAAKARGFLADAKDAVRAGDWDRARSLAKKAQVLSQELIQSL